MKARAPIALALCALTWWWEVSFDDVKDTPDWKPGDEPPLPVSKAIQLAEAQVPT